ncbi:hypothetical protein D3C83_05800 [compost metagenome]
MARLVLADDRVARRNPRPPARVYELPDLRIVQLLKKVALPEKAELVAVGNLALLDAELADLGDLEGKIGPRGIPVLGPLAQGPQDDRVQLGGQRGLHDARGDGILMRDLVEQVIQCRGREGPPAREQLVEHHAQGVHVIVQRQLRSVDLLRGHVARRPDQHVLV